MPADRADRPCPCRSGRKYKRCCAPFHQGRPAPTPEALMRSRYSAYALGLVGYLVDTTDPAGPHWQADRAAWEAELRTYCAAARFRDLEILEAAGDTVAFRYRLRMGDRELTTGERSRFTRDGDRWRYHAGEALPSP